MLQNQSNLKQFDLVEELNEQASETISGGGREVFTVRNETRFNIKYRVDGKRGNTRPGAGTIWTTNLGGRIRFDKDTRSGIVQRQRYNLVNGGLYAFRENTSTKGNPFDIELYRIS